MRLMTTRTLISGASFSLRAALSALPVFFSFLFSFVFQPPRRTISATGFSSFSLFLFFFLLSFSLRATLYTHTHTHTHTHTLSLTLSLSLSLSRARAPEFYKSRARLMLLDQEHHSAGGAREGTSGGRGMGSGVCVKLKD